MPLAAQHARPVFSLCRARFARSHRAKKIFREVHFDVENVLQDFGECVQLLLMSSLSDRSVAVVASEWFISPAIVLDTEVVSVSRRETLADRQGP
jgi:hypothetical protein